MSTTLDKSVSVIFVSEGRQTPFLNNCSAMLPPTKSYSSKYGCICIGFHTGRDSIFSFSNASIISIGLTRPFNVKQDNQKLGSRSEERRVGKESRSETSSEY